MEVRRVEALPECLMRLKPQLLLLDLSCKRAGMLQDSRRCSKCALHPHHCVPTGCSEEHEVALFRAGIRGVARWTCRAKRWLKR